MRILIVVPALSPPHGGIRVYLEWANRLAERHEVVVHSMKRPHCDWFALSPKLIISTTYQPAGMDCLILTSPHSIEFADRPNRPRKVFLFMQMMEHLFRPNDRAWVRLCHKFYTSRHPLISISQWNRRELRSKYDRRAPTHYVGNGVNLDDFPIDASPKDNRTVLIEGLAGYNPTKDCAGMGLEVARRLTRDGYNVMTYSQIPLKPAYLDAVREYHCCPSLGQLNLLYKSATILVKASRYDARACAPMEAMTKGTVTARAILEGDDDLIHNENCLRSTYNLDALHTNVMRLLNDVPLRMRLSKACLEHVQKFSWDYWMSKIEEIIC